MLRRPQAFDSRCITPNMLSGLRLMLSICRSISHRAKPGRSEGACPQMPQCRPWRCAPSMACSINFNTLYIRREAIGQRCFKDQLAQFSGSCSRHSGIGPVGAVQYAHHLLPESFEIDHAAVGFNRNSKALRYFDPVMQSLRQLAKRGIFTAHKIEIVHADFIKPTHKPDMWLLVHHRTISFAQIASAALYRRNSVTLRTVCQWSTDTQTTGCRFYPKLHIVVPQ